MAQVTGGDKVEAALARIERKIASTTARPSVKIGFMKGAPYPDGASVPMVAAIQEFGAPRASIPPRPYFRNMIAKHKEEWPKQAAKLLAGNDYNIKLTLGLMGELIAGELQQSIKEIMDPPLSQVTLMLRKMRSQDQTLVVTARTVGEAARRVAAGESTAGVSTKPLVDSGHLLNSVTYQVIEGNE